MRKDNLVLVFTSTKRSTQLPMSLRPGVQCDAQAPRKGRRSTRLDEVLRAGQNSSQDAPPTGVLGPLLSNLPGRIERPQFPRGPPRPNMPPMPDEAPGNDGNERAYRRAIDRKMVRDMSQLLTDESGNTVECLYTGEVINNKPDGFGEEIRTGSIALSKSPRADIESLQKRVTTLKHEGASEEQLREARAEVERLADIPRARYDEAWESIRAYARSKKSRWVTQKLFSRWARDHRDKWDLFGGNADMDYQPFVQQYMAPFFIAGNEMTDDVLTNSEFAKGVDALKRGEVDIVADRALPEESPKYNLWQSTKGTWSNGMLIDGETVTRLSDETDMVKRITMGTKTVGGTRHVSLRTETYEGDKLVHKVFLENLAKISGGYAMSGRILLSSRPTSMRFPWAKSTEQVKLRKGEGVSLFADASGTTNELFHFGNVSHVLKLSGYAEVRLTVEATGEHVWLFGDMVDNKLMGEITASGPIPGLPLDGIDRRFYIDGYDANGVPLVRLPSAEEADERPSPPPENDEDLNTEDVREPSSRDQKISNAINAIGWGLVALMLYSAWSIATPSEKEQKKWNRQIARQR